MRKYIIMGLRAAARGRRRSCWPRTSTSSTSASATSSAGTSRTTPSSGRGSSASWRGASSSPTRSSRRWCRPGWTMHDWNYGFILDGFPRNRRPGRVLPRELRHRRGDPDRRARRGRPRAHPEPPAVLELRPRLQPDLPPPGRAPTCATCAAGALVPRADDTPRRSASVCTTTTPRREPILDLFARRSWSSSSTARQDPTRSRPRCAIGSACRRPRTRWASDAPAAKSSGPAGKAPSSWRSATYGLISSGGSPLSWCWCTIPRLHSAVACAPAGAGLTSSSS